MPQAVLNVEDVRSQVGQIRIPEWLFWFCQLFRGPLDRLVSSGSKGFDIVSYATYRTLLAVSVALDIPRD